MLWIRGKAECTAVGFLSPCGCLCVEGGMRIFDLVLVLVAVFLRRCMVGPSSGWEMMSSFFVSSSFLSLKLYHGSNGVERDGVDLAQWRWWG